MPEPQTLIAPTPETAETPAPSAPAPESIELEEQAGAEVLSEAEPTQTPIAEQTPTPTETRPSQVPVRPQPSPTQEDRFAQLSRQYEEQQQQQQRANAQLATQLAEANDVRLVEQYQANLETQYPGVDFSRVVGAYRSMLAQERTAEQRQQILQQNYENRLGDQDAKYKLALRFSTEFGMPVNELLAIDVEGPKHMRTAARAWKAEQELDKFRKAQVKPSTPTNSSPSRARVSVTADNIDKLYMEGKVSGAVYQRFMDTGSLT